MPGDSQVCNCNGVTKQAICDVVADGCTALGGVMDRTRAGKGCGSCKSLVKQVVEWAADGELTEDPAASYYVPGIPMAKPELVAAIREGRAVTHTDFLTGVRYMQFTEAVARSSRHQSPVTLPLKEFSNPSL